MRIVTLSCALVLLLVAGCGEGRHSPGFVLGQDGQPRYNNSANVRKETERTIERALDRELAPHWRAQAAIADEPRWNDGREAWLWPATTVRVELSGDAAYPPPLDIPTITAAVVDYFAGRMADSATTVQVAVTTAKSEATATISPSAPTTQPAASAAPAAATTVVNDGQRYVIQPGDALARISAVFYGSAQHWRRLLDANPGLVPEALPVGKEIVVPPALAP